MSRPPSRLLVYAGLATAAWLGVATPPAGAQESATDLHFALRLRNSGETFLGRLIPNCQLFEGAGWSLPETLSKYTFATEDGPAIGALDIAGRRGSAYVKSGGLQVERILTPRPFAIRFADLGVTLDGSRMFLVGRVTRGTPQTAAARRVRLAVVRRAKYETGPLLDRRNKPVPSTFSFSISGRLTMLAAMTRAFDRTRCKGPRTSSRPFRPGYELGRLAVNVRPDVAVGLEGTSRLTPDIRDFETDAPISVEPTAGATRGTDGALAAPLASGVPLACAGGAYCIPASGDVGLPSFDLVFNGRRASIAGVVLTSTRGTARRDTVQETVTGTLDGAPVTVATGTREVEAGRQLPLDLTEDFVLRLSAALGTSIGGSLRLEFLFTRTGPA